MSNNNPHNTRVSMEVSPEWQRLMRLGEILGKVKISLISLICCY